jgi:hypothetical protein
MYAITITVAIGCLAAGIVLAVAVICTTEAGPRPNRRGGRLGKWLRFHGGLK